MAESPTESEDMSTCSEGSDTESSQDEDDVNWDYLLWRGSALHPYSCSQSPKDFKYMQRILKDDRDAVNRVQESESMDPPLFVAVYCQHVRCVEFLIDEQADVDQESYQGRTPLEQAVEHFCSATSYFEILRAGTIIKLLLENGSTSNYMGNDYAKTYFLSAILGRTADHYELLKLFLEHGADTEDWEAIRQGSFDYKTPLYSAMVSEDITASKLLFLYGAEINLHDVTDADFYLSKLKPIPHVLIKKYLCGSHSNLRVLQLYREFGGSFNVLYKGQTPLEYFNTKSLALEQRKENWCHYKLALQQFSNSPLSLFNLCRLVVCHRLDKRRGHKVKDLQLPREIQCALKFKTN